MNDQNYYRVSVKGIVFDEQGRVLLSREENDKWEILGGGLDHGEDPITCLKREISEEAGLEVTYISPQPIFFLTCPRLGADTFVANVIYEIRLKNLDFTPSDECQELRFFTPQEVRALGEKAYPNITALGRLLP